MATKPELLDEAQAAEFIGMSIAFLQAGRSRGVIGKRTATPAFLKLGRSIKYDVVDLQAWLAARRVDPANRRRANRTDPAAVA
jgi:hypothetical protein